MRRLCYGLMLLAFTAVCRADDAADQPVLVLQSGGHTAAIVKLLFTPDGQRLLTVSEDHTIRVWDHATGERLAVLRLPATSEGQGVPRCGALSADGKTLAVGGDPYQVDGKPIARVFLIDLAAGAAVGVLPGGEVAVRSLAFSHDGKRLAGGDQDGKIHIWNVQGLKTVNLLEAHRRVVWDVAFSPDDKVLASASADETARLWDPESGQKVGQPMHHTGAVLSLAWQSDDALLTGNRGWNHSDSLHLWNRVGEPVKDFDDARQGSSQISSLSYIPGSNELLYLWTADYDAKGPQLRKNGAAVLDLKTEATREGPAWENHIDAITGAVSPDGRTAAFSGDDDRGVSLWSLKDGALTVRLAGAGATPFWAGWSPDSKAVGWSNVQNTDPEAAPPGRHKGNGKPAGPKVSAKTLQRSFDLTELKLGKRPDDNYLRSPLELDGVRRGLGQNSPGDELNLHDATTKPETRLPRIKTTFKVHSCTLLRHGRLAVGGADIIEIYNARTAERIKELHCAGGIVWDLAPSPDGRYLLAAFADQTLRVYDPDQEYPLLSLFVAGADWIVWTEQGYYAASPSGEKFMGWQVNRGLDKLGTFYPAEQFHKAFYRPDIIKRVLAEGGVEKARAAADKESGQATVPVSVAQALPPDVKVLAPAAGKQDLPEVEVKAEASSKDRPVLTMHLLLDGRPCPRADALTFAGARPGEKQTAAWKVTLPDGGHRLAVLAETDASLGASPEVGVSYQSPPPPGPPEEPGPTLYVLAVGINAYPGSLRLDWAADDAAAVQKAFQVGGAPKPFGKVDAKLLLDKDATKAGILAGLDWLKTKMTADDTAVVFYAGHGHRDKKTSQFYMLPQDVNVGDLDKTGVTGTAIKEKLKAVPGKVLVLLDACHSGSIGQSPAEPGSLTDDVQRQLAAPDCGVVVMCAAMAQEEAGEAAAVRHGYFTAALLQGLGGEAPASKDGLIHLAALDFYVEEEVAELSKEEQHVVVDRPSTLTSFPLVKPATKSGGE